MRRGPPNDGTAHLPNPTDATPIDGHYIRNPDTPGLPRLERALKRAGHEHRERQLTVRLHPEVALYLLEEEPKLLQTLSKLTGLDVELRDDPMMRLDEFRLMSRPAGRDVTELYAVA